MRRCNFVCSDFTTRLKYHNNYTTFIIFIIILNLVTKSVVAVVGLGGGGAAPLHVDARRAAHAAQGAASPVGHRPGRVRARKSLLRDSLAGITTLSISSFKPFVCGVYCIKTTDIQRICVTVRPTRR